MNALPADLTITVYRLIQECLTNAVRYSRARTITIQLSADTTQSDDRPVKVRLSVEESEVIPEDGPVRANGSGLLGMRERVEAHGGRVSSRHR